MKQLTKLLIVCVVLFLSSCNHSRSEDLTLWYNDPATDWMTEALHFGNGYIGAMFFGGIEEEHIQFAEGSLWSGGPGSNTNYNYGIREGVSKYLPEVRELLKQGKKVEADKLLKAKLTGKIDKKSKQYNGWKRKSLVAEYKELRRNQSRIY